MATYNVVFSENPYFTYNVNAKPLRSILRASPHCSSSGCPVNPRSQSTRRVTFFRYETVRPGSYYDGVHRRAVPSDVEVRDACVVSPLLPVRARKPKQNRSRQQAARQGERYDSPPARRSKSAQSTAVNAGNRFSAPPYGSKSTKARKSSTLPNERRVSSTTYYNFSREEGANLLSSQRHYRETEGNGKREGEGVAVKRRHRKSDKDRTQCCKKCAKLAEQRRVEERHAERTARRSSGARSGRSKS